MTNRQILEDLLLAIDKSAKNQTRRADFALSLIQAIESLDDLPFSIIDEARDWQYKIETDGDALLSPSSTHTIALKTWVKHLISIYT